MNAPKIEDLQALSKQQIEAATAFASTMTKGLQELASETAEFSRQNMAASAQTMQKLFGAKSMETAMQIQQDYAKSAYEGFVARSSKVNQIVGKIASAALQPVRETAAKA